MIKSRTPFIIVLLLGILPISAQEQIEHYALAPDYMQQIMTDIISSECTTVQYSDGAGHYVGHSRDNQFFGWGSYTSNNGNRWIGQWHKGKCVFGILIKGNIARVGSESHYIEYDLTSGYINHIFKNEERFTFTLEEAEESPYRFVTTNYDNGDSYIGETKDGYRHGQGIYFWTNGSFWYGTYCEDYRQGYGALFAPNGNISHGHWLGATKQTE